MTESAFRILDPGEAGYPEGLSQLESPPRLWWKGTLDPVSVRGVSIIGTRHPTPYGQRIARRLAEGCARAGFTVVSGLAIGIDAVGHLGALDAPGGSTIAILGSGLERVHPVTNSALADRIAEHGAVVSAYPPGTPPGKHRFLERNALIAAMSRVLIVIEGVHPSSGALSTAARARELGRPVLAVPGMITTPEASGPNHLIRDGCAPCLDVGDVAAALALAEAGAWPREQRPALVPPPQSALVADATSRDILEVLEQSSLDLAAIASATRLELRVVAQTLVDLELGGHVRRTAHGLYEV